MARVDVFGITWQSSSPGVDTILFLLEVPTSDLIVVAGIWIFEGVFVGVEAEDRPVVLFLSTSSRTAAIFVDGVVAGCGLGLVFCKAVGAVLAKVPLGAGVGVLAVGVPSET
jgi:hypothetical protein